MGNSNAKHVNQLKLFYAISVLTTEITNYLPGLIIIIAELFRNL